MEQKKDYTWAEYSELPQHIKIWATKISVEDGRPAHPEDYVEYANELLAKANNNQVWANALFERVCCLRNNPKCHTDVMYSFLDFWNYIIGRFYINASIEAYRRGDYMTSEELLEQIRRRISK